MNAAIVNLAKLRKDKLVSQHNTYEKYKAAYKSQENIVGGIDYEFLEHFAKMLDLFVINKNKYLLSPEQERLIDKYFAEADGIMSSEVKQLDEFLAAYKEEIINE